MINSLLLLLCLQLVGDGVAAALRLPVPGMVLGLALLLGILTVRGHRLGAERAIPPALAATAATLHGHLGLLFVPAGVGILAHRDLLAAEGPAILAAVVVSTLLALWLTAVIAAGTSAASARVRPGVQEERP